MTKDEALKLALETLEYAGPSWIDARQPAITAIKEVLAQKEPNYKKALEVWLDKTEWVQKTVKPHELGMHRADVLKQRVEEALAQPEQDVGIIRYADISVGKIIYTAPPQRTWVGLTDEDFLEACQIAERGNYLVAFQRIQAKLKEKNT